MIELKVQLERLRTQELVDEQTETVIMMQDVVEKVST